MSRENVERVRRLFDDFNNGDTAGFFKWFHPDLAYRNREDEPDVRWYHGLDDFKAYIGTWWESFEDLRLEADEIRDVRDHVLASTTLRGRGRETGLDVGGRYVFLLRFRDDLIVEGREYATTGEALEAVGLRE